MLRDMSAIPDPHTGPNVFFASDHRRCDELWTKVEAVADEGDAGATGRAFAAFDAAMRQHLGLEEEILFPALEDATGMRMGPTQVMRMEHQQMRGVLDARARAIHGGDVDGMLDHGGTLMMLIQQHNVKEEGILYPMAERAFAGPAWAELAEKIARQYVG